MNGIVAIALSTMHRVPVFGKKKQNVTVKSGLVLVFWLRYKKRYNPSQTKCLRPLMRQNLTKISSLAPALAGVLLNINLDLERDIMSNARKLKLERIIDRLKEVQFDSTMKTATFESRCNCKLELPRTHKEVTPFIVERTEVWRETWVTLPLLGIIDDLSTEMTR